MAKGIVAGGKILGATGWVVIVVVLLVTYVLYRNYDQNGQALDFTP
jgi:hypothetical protein